MSAIVCHALSKRYGTLSASHDLEMTVLEGTIFGFLGANGAGRTTAIRILATLSHLTAGEACGRGLDSGRMI